mmetsp:Transcript_32270/g.43023  ORF Transcript_32270/g.43023 Transcript_32270/m.43023 type:complete len:81 (-) Transcript_32270:536-778(-)
MVRTEKNDSGIPQPIPKLRMVIETGSINPKVLCLDVWETVPVCDGLRSNTSNGDHCQSSIKKLSLLLYFVGSIIFGLESV